MSDLENRFNHHPPKDEPTVRAHERVRAAMLAAAEELNLVVPVGREHALMLTNLEQAMFWANAGIARN